MPNTALKGYSVQAAGSNAGTWGAGASTALNEGLIEIIDLNMAGNFAQSLSSTNVTISATNGRNCNYRLTGTLTANVQVTIPTNGFYFVENLTSGAFSVTVTNGVDGTVITQGDRVPLFADSTNGVRQMVPANSGITPDLTNTTLSVTAAYTVTNSDIRKTLVCTGVCYQVTFSAPAGYSASFACRVTNASTTRAKTVSMSGLATFFLWPGQSCTVFISDGIWACDPSAIGLRYRPAASLAVMYVDPVLGNPDNDGLASGLGGALGTIQQAVDRYRNYFDCGISGECIIHLATGVYDVGDGVEINTAGIGRDVFTIIGDDTSVTTAANYLIQCTVANGYCFFVRDQGIVRLKGMKFQATASGCTAISASQGATVDLEGNCVFDAFSSGTHMDATTWASINVLTNYSVVGNVSTHIRARNGAYINYGSFTCTTTTTAVTNWAVASNCGVINAGGVAMTFAGSGAGSGTTGTKYTAAYNGVIVLDGSTYPGATAGTTAAGGQVSP